MKCLISINEEGKLPGCFESIECQLNKPKDCSNLCAGGYKGKKPTISLQYISYE